MANPEEKLCIRAQQGDAAAASELLKLFYKRIYCYLRRLTNTTADAEDLTQETFASVWAALGSFHRQCSFSSWVHRIAYNKYIDWLRVKKQAAVQPEEWWETIADKNPGPFKQAQARQLAECLYRAVEALDEDKRQAVHLHYYQGLSLKETAYVLNKAPATVKYRLREALKQLRLQIDSAKVFQKDMSFQSQKRTQNA